MDPFIKSYVAYLVFLIRRLCKTVNQVQSHLGIIGLLDVRYVPFLRIRFSHELPVFGEPFFVTFGEKLLGVL